MSHNEKDFEQNMNSAKNKELTQKQREAAADPEEAKNSEHEAVKNVAEAASHEKELSAEQKAQKEEAHHEGHLEPNRLNFNQYDNTSEVYDKAKGTPAAPDLRESTDGPIEDHKGSVVDAGTDARTGEQDSVGVNTDDNYGTGNPEADDDSDKDVKASEKKDK